MIFTTSATWFSTGKLAGHYAKIYRQTIEGASTLFTCRRLCPSCRSAGDTFSAFVYVPPDQANAVANGGAYEGFPYVPTPINSTILIS